MARNIITRTVAQAKMASWQIGELVHITFGDFSPDLEHPPVNHWFTFYDISLPKDHVDNYNAISITSGGVLLNTTFIPGLAEYGERTKQQQILIEKMEKKVKGILIGRTEQRILAWLLGVAAIATSLYYAPCVFREIYYGALACIHFVLR